MAANTFWRGKEGRREEQRGEGREEQRGEEREREGDRGGREERREEKPEKEDVKTQGEAECKGGKKRKFNAVVNYTCCKAVSYAQRIAVHTHTFHFNLAAFALICLLTESCIFLSEATSPEILQKHQERKKIKDTLGSLIVAYREVVLILEVDLHKEGRS